MTASPTLWLRRAALVGVGFGLVVGARVLGRGEVPEPAPQVEPRSEPPVEAPDLASTIAAPGEIPGLPAPDDPEACAELHAIVAERLDAIQEAASEIEGLEILLSGEPVPWPDDTPATLREDAVRTAFREAAAAVGEGLVLKDLRCEEYPCIGVFERLDDEEGEWWRTDPRWSDALTEKLGDMEATRGARVTPLKTWRGGPDNNHLVALTLHTPDLGDAASSRLHHRTVDLELETRPWRTVTLPP